MKYKKYLLFLWNFWLPFVGSGIKITSVSNNFRDVTVRLKKRPWTSNYVGTQYGGSMFSMTDPFYMVMLVLNLGRDFIVWDKSAKISYLKPGRTALTAKFHMSDETLQSIRSQAIQHGKTEWDVVVQIKDSNDVVVAEVEKKLWIKYKNIKTD